MIKILWSLLMLVFATSVFADDHSFMSGLARQAQSIQANPTEVVGASTVAALKSHPAQRRSSLSPPPSLDYQQAMDALTGHSAAIGGNGLAGRPPACAQKNFDGTYIFVSLSMERGELASIMREAQLYGATLVVRGVRKDESIEHYIGAWASIGQQAHSDADVEMEPNLFQKYGVKQVPETVIVKGSKVGKVEGVANIGWLKNKIAMDGYKDFGVNGNQVAIIEPDFVSEAKRRMKKLNWAKLREEAKANFWLHYHFTTLPQGTRGKTRIFDPSIVTTKDIVAPNGQLIAAAGTHFNPLNEVTLTRRYVVIDPLVKSEIARVKRALAAEQPPEPVTVLLTRVDRKHPVRTFSQVAQAFESPVFLYTQLVQSRFGLTQAPAIIEQDGKRVKIQELGIH